MATADLRAPKPKTSVTTLSVVDDVTEIVFRAEVQPEGGGPTPTGAVTFKDGSTTIGTVQLGGQFTMTTSPSTVTAYYGGDKQYAPSQSSTISAPVGRRRLS